MGYILDMKVGEKNCFIFLATCFELILKIWQIEIYFLWNLVKFWANFFIKKIFCLGRNHIFKVKIW